MEESKQWEGDLGFVREAVRRSEAAGSPFSIYLFWAVAIVVGFALVDFASLYVGLYWMIVGPVGGAISAILGRRHAKRIGQQNRRIGIRYAMHFGGMMVTIILAVLLVLSGSLSYKALSQLILLLVAFSYFLAGVHLERPLLWIGLLMAAGYVAVLFIPGYTWTIVGVIVALGLIAAAIKGGQASVPATN
jgi:hypothetical protein